MAKFCNQCGAPLKPETKFCPSCGAPVHVSAAPAVTEEKPQKPIPQESQDTKPVPVRDDRRTGKIILLAIVLVIAAVGGVFLWKKISRDNARKALYDSIELRFDERAQGDTVILTWYENGKTDPCSYVTYDKYDIKASPEFIDVSVLGDTEVTYTVTAESEETGVVEKTFVKTFSVRDTTTPSISLKYTNVTVKDSDGYSIRDNIERIHDDHDGELAYREEKTEETGTAYYTLTADGDPSVPGVHVVTVYAVDEAGNEATETFVLRVRETEKPEQEAAPEEESWTETRIVAVPLGCSVNFNDVDRLYRELEQYGNEYTSPAYGTEAEMRSALREFEADKYPDRRCQVYPGLHRQRGSAHEWIFYDYDPYQ